MLLINFDSDGIAANWEKYMLENHFPEMENVRELNKHPNRSKLIGDVYKRDPHVFRKLEPIEDFHRLIAWVEDKGLDYRILTSCGSEHHDYDMVVDDKRYFFYANFGIAEDKVMVTKTSADKRMYAGSNQVLVDDFDVNCEQWEENGGIAVEVESNIYDVDKLIFVLEKIVSDYK